MKTHGMTGTTEWRTWNHIKDRCNNQNNKSYKNYGGRGIKVSQRWNRFENFFKDMGKRPTGTSLDRVDNSKGYSKSNCKWRTMKEQTNNCRKNILFTINGETKTLSQWVDFYNSGIHYDKIYNRIQILGWDAKKALTTPILSFKEAGLMGGVKSGISRRKKTLKARCL